MSVFGRESQLLGSGRYASRSSSQGRGAFFVLGGPQRTTATSSAIHLGSLLDSRRRRPFVECLAEFVAAIRCGPFALGIIRPQLWTLSEPALNARHGEPERRGGCVSSTRPAETRLDAPHGFHATIRGGLADASDPTNRAGFGCGGDDQDEQTEQNPFHHKTPGQNAIGGRASMYLARHGRVKFGGSSRVIATLLIQFHNRTLQVNRLIQALLVRMLQPRRQVERILRDRDAVFFHP